MRVLISARSALIAVACAVPVILATAAPTQAIDATSATTLIAEPLVPDLPSDATVVWAAPSGNGRTVFLRTKAILLPDLTFTDRFRVYAVDTVTRRLRVVTDDGAFSPAAVSFDGRFLVGSRQVDDSVNDVVAVDTVTGSTHPFDLPEPMTFLRQVSISADGTTIAFTGTTGLGATLSHNRLFVADVASGDVLEPFAGADGDLFDAFLSADGGTIAVSSSAENLDLPLGSTGSDAIVWDRFAGTVEYAHVTTDGGVPNDQSTVAGLSPDGSTVIVRSWATNLPGAEAPADPTMWRPMQLFRFDRATGSMDGVTLPGGAADPGTSETAVVAPDALHAAAFDQSTGAMRVVDLTSGRAQAVTAPGGPFVAVGQWSDPVSFDASGSLLVVVAAAGSVTIEMGGYNAFATGLPPAGTDADVYEPPPSALPPGGTPGTGSVVPTPRPVDPVAEPANGPGVDPVVAEVGSTCVPALLGAERQDCVAEMVVGYLVRDILLRAAFAHDAAADG